MKKTIVLACLFSAGSATASETMKGEFFVGGRVDPVNVSHTMIKLSEGKYQGCKAITSGKLVGDRLMLNVDKIDCNGKIIKRKGTVYDEAGVKGVDVTVALPGRKTIMPGQGVIVKLR